MFISRNVRQANNLLTISSLEVSDLPLVLFYNCSKQCCSAPLALKVVYVLDILWIGYGDVVSSQLEKHASLILRKTVRRLPGLAHLYYP